MAVSWSPNGDLLAISAGNSIYIYTSVDWEQRARLPVGALTHALQFSPDQKQLAAGSQDGNLRIWQVGNALQNPDAPPTFLLDAHRKAVNDLDFTSVGDLLATGGNDGIARFWDPIRGEMIGMTIGGSFAVPSIAFSPDETFLAVINGDQIRLRQPGSERIIGSFKAGAPLFHVNLSKDGKQIFATGADNRIRIWNVDDAYKTGQTTYPDPQVFEGHSGQSNSYKALVWDAAVSPDGLEMASVGGDGRLIIWDLSSGDIIGTRMVHVRGATCVAYHPGGLMLATGGLDGSIKIWR